MAAGDIVLSAAEKAALLTRLQSATLEGGDFSTPSQREHELALILHAVVTAIGATG